MFVSPKDRQVEVLCVLPAFRKYTGGANYSPGQQSGVRCHGEVLGCWVLC